MTEEVEEENDSTDFDDLDPQWQEALDLMYASPPLPVRVVEFICFYVTLLVLSLIVMVQWVFWIILTMEIYEPWTGVIGGAIAVAQMGWIFGRKQATQSCEIPVRSEASEESSQVTQ